MKCGCLLAAPLYELATKGTDFEWTERRNEAFRQLKNALTSVPILGSPREEGLLYLDTDPSDVGTGAVLSQIQDGEKRVFAYVSKLLEGKQGAVGGGSGIKILQMLSIRAEDHDQDGQQRRELATQE